MLLNTKMKEVQGLWWMANWRRGWCGGYFFRGVVSCYPVYNNWYIGSECKSTLYLSFFFWCRVSRRVLLGKWRFEINSIALVFWYYCDINYPLTHIFQVSYNDINFVLFISVSGNAYLERGWWRVYKTISYRDSAKKA